MKTKNTIGFETRRAKEKRSSELSIINPLKLLFKGHHHTYEILGRLSNDVTDMTIMLVAIDDNNLRRVRRKINLFHQNQFLNLCNDLAIELEVETSIIESELSRLTDLLERFRDDEQAEEPLFKKSTSRIKPALQKKAIAILNNPDVLNLINDLLESAGIVGEEKMRLVLFIVASTYKSKTPLHAIIQGGTGTGKSHLINTIASCFPQEDVLSMTRVTSKSLFHYQSEQLQNKLVIIQDFDGLEGSAQFALRELQSANQISSSSTKKDRFGKLVPSLKIIEASFSSLTSTTKQRIYEDNLSRSIVVGMDESTAQTKRINAHQNKLIAGIDSEQKRDESKTILRIIIKLLKPKQVSNYFLTQISLPEKISSGRRILNQFLILVNQLTHIRQFQRKINEDGKLIATKKDVIDGINLFADILFTKTDELDPSTRQFFERLKIYIKKKQASTNKHFSARDLRVGFNESKTQIFRFLDLLRVHHFITVIGGSANKGFIYSISNCDNPHKEFLFFKKNLLIQVKKMSETKLTN